MDLFDEFDEDESVLDKLERTNIHLENVSYTLGKISTNLYWIGIMIVIALAKYMGVI